MITVEEFRAEVRAWLDDNLVGEYAALRGLGGPGREHEAFEERLAWNRHLAAAGLTCLGWPVEHGGRGLSVAHRVAFYEEWSARQEGAEGELRAAFAKIESYSARLTLLHHVVSHVAAGVSDLCPITAASAEAGIELARWFAHEATRIYSMLRESAEEGGGEARLRSKDKIEGTVCGNEVGCMSVLYYPSFPRCWPTPPGWHARSLVPHAPQSKLRTTSPTEPTGASSLAKPLEPTAPGESRCIRGGSFGPPSGD